ncbi:peroxisome biogenesis protein 16 isoform X2 [Impatiens glandulifera]|nr:peroxisome biogenesis protein 16 isoform X2 [Impatiens glandulifera]
MVTAINEHIISTTPRGIRHAQQSGERNSSFPYSLCITLLKEMETIVEVVAEQYFGDDKKWNFIAISEATKVLVRLILFRDSGYKLLLHGGEISNEEQDSLPITPLDQTKGYPPKKPGRHQQANNQWNLEGRAMSALSRFGDNGRFTSEPSWLHKVQHHQQTIIEPPSPKKPTLSEFISEKGFHGTLFIIGEVLFITRPLIYVLLVRKYGLKSWFPWCISLAVDLSGFGILSRVLMTRDGRNSQPFHISDLENDEMKRRKMLWALYLMRDPFFSKYTRQRVESTGKLMENVPILGFLAEKVTELIVGAQTRYTYMSGS